MSKFLSAGGLAGLLSFGAALATAFGKNSLAGVLGDPQTAATVGTLATGIGAVVAGVLSNRPKAKA